MFPRRAIGTNGYTGAGDPSKNVMDLVNAAIARVDDLRESETRHQREVARLLTERVESMMMAESHRIDAIRAVDVDAVQKAASAMATQATSLATQQVQSAEALRTQVSETATLAETRLAAALQPIVRDVAELQKRAWETAGGKTQVIETQAKGGTTSSWMGLAVAACIGFLSIIMAVAAIVISVIAHKA